MCAPRGVLTAVRWKGSSRHHLRVSDHHCFITHHTFSTGSIIFMINNQLFLPLWGPSAAIDGTGRCMLKTMQAQEPGPHSLHSELPVVSTVGTEWRRHALEEPSGTPSVFLAQVGFQEEGVSRTDAPSRRSQGESIGAWMCSAEARCQLRDVVGMFGCHGARVSSSSCLSDCLR